MKKTRCTAALAMVAVMCTAPAHPQLNFCFGPTIARSVPNPVFDGNIDGDNGWLNSFLYRGGNGAPDADIILQGNSFTDGGGHQWLALGASVLNDTEWDAGDSVVILFKSGSGSYNEIVVSPLENDVAPTTPIANGRPGASQYSTSSTGSPGTWTLVGNAPSWVTWGSVGTAGGGACTAAQPGTACKWTVELGIDTTAAAAAGVTGIISLNQLYVDVVAIFDRSGPMSYQSSWPNGNTLVDGTDFTITPAVANWGGASTSPNACKGVSVSYADISASPLDVGGNLQAGLSTTLTAKLHNSGANANGVIAHFSHAPFGVCGLVDSCFTEFGTSNTPVSCPNGGTPPSCCTGTAACIPPDMSNNAGTALQASWTPTNADDGHQCIRVKLEATQAGTTFASSGDFHNMWVDHSSNVDVHARIDMTKVPAPEGGGNQRVRLYSYRQTQYAFSDGTAPGVAAATFTAQIITQYRGYRYTGKHVTVNRVKSEIWDPVGSYAYTIQHEVDQAFETGFEQRNATVFDRFCANYTAARTTSGSGDCITTLKARMRKDPALVQQVNTALASLAETPKVTDWTFDLQGVKHVGNNPDQVELEVPLNSAVMLPTKISYVAGKKRCFDLVGAGVPVSAFGLTILGLGVYLPRKRKE
ncbi:hypothetical protein EDE15_3547 [Edaphobacter aggregans]|uniref:Secreted protein (IPTL-CTERM system target) n=1 Tax=Edaphobacter aggregans TaxID=570835 RepID=A0A3R9PBH2_9BACT|nr:hypothetical protein [Edaphobacter aggregans]RSL17994.1 hypothetical protein EDE15_3547 [Edaphobacter aggregans]